MANSLIFLTPTPTPTPTFYSTAHSERVMRFLPLSIQNLPFNIPLRQAGGISGGNVG